MNWDAEEITVGMLCDAVFAVETEDEAKKFYDEYIAYLKRQPGCDRPIYIAKANIGWFFGEGMSQDKIDMWVRATGAFHPVFGAKAPSIEEAFEWVRV